MGSHLTTVMWEGVAQLVPVYFRDPVERLLLWGFVHPLPDGSLPETLGAVMRRFRDHVALCLEVEAITPETGTAHHNLALRVQAEAADERLFASVAGIAEMAIRTFIASGRSVDHLDPAPMTEERNAAAANPGGYRPLDETMKDDIPF